MAESIEEAITEAINELKLKDWVIDVEWDQIFSEDKPCNYVRKRLNVLHQTQTGDYEFSGKELYINKSDFTYLWHYGGGPLESISSPFRDLMISKIPMLKAALGVDWAEVTSVDEINESGTATCIKTTTGNYAETWYLKTWKIDATTVGFKIVQKTLAPT